MKKLTKQEIFDLVTNKKPKDSNIDDNYYVKVFTEVRKQKETLRFNKAAFFSSLLFTPIFWLIYRKMYLKSIIFTISISILTMLINFKLIDIIFALYIGLTGNSIYLEFIEKKYAKGVKKIGTNLYGTLGLAILFALFIGLLIYYLNNIYNTAL